MKIIDDIILYSEGRGKRHRSILGWWRKGERGKIEN
jgi:hypothetical protein